MYLVTGDPIQAALKEKVHTFLSACGLEADPNVSFTAVLMEDDEILATGSLDGGVIKCVAVSPAHQGEDLTARIMTALVQKASQEGLKQLMLYTKPRNQMLFMPFGFYPVVRTSDVLIMENARNGLQRFLESLPKPADDRGPVGCIVANGNPFTRGHRYLVETAAAQCAWVHLFILSEDRSEFSPEMRLQMAHQACRDLPNVLVHPTGPYMVSSATFPTYFIKDKARAGAVYCEADVKLFGEKIAPALHVTRRYVGTEPLCPVTRQYNETMKRLLPAYGIELVEVERLCIGDEPVSASRVRERLKQGQPVEDLVPEASANILAER